METTHSPIKKGYSNKGWAYAQEVLVFYQGMDARMMTILESESILWDRNNKAWEEHHNSDVNCQEVWCAAGMGTLLGCVHHLFKGFYLLTTG